MSTRLDKTLADYLAIAVSPAMIMTLVGSLVFFLLEVFYRGHFQGRMQFILAMFVMAAVLIGRIAIEEGTERARLFALPLAVVTFLAIRSFVSQEGGPLLISLALLALIWWSAHKLTWDCTLIDEEEDASGEGLLQVVGLDETAGGKSEKSEPKSETQKDEGATLELLGSKFLSNIVQRLSTLSESGSVKHAPGVWIVYFSLAALPVFGLGQRLIPAGDVVSRRHVFWLLCVYVASGLGLLLTTSFLGLRRYLRQRRVEMPAAMAGTWITAGSVLAVALLVVAAILPRPASEYPISDLPFGIGALRHTPSRLAMGSEGVEQRQQLARAGKVAERSDSDAGGNQQQARQSTGQSGQSDDQQQSSDQSQDSQSGGQAQDGQKSGGGSQDENAASGSKGQKGGSGQQGGQSRGQGGKSGRDKSQGSRQQGSEPQQGERGSQQSDRSSRQSEQESRQSGNRSSSEDESRTDEAQSGQSGSRPSMLHQIMPHSMGGWFTTLFRWILFAAIAIVGGVWLWRSWDKIVAGFRDLLADLRAFWQRLFGGGRTARLVEADAGPVAVAPPPRPFSAFADPFATGMDARSSPEELVRYSFEALEAWGREHGWPRAADTTPHEFAQDLGVHVAALGRETRRLADLYCSAAYAPGRLRPANVEQLRRLWQKLRSEG